VTTLFTSRDNDREISPPGQRWARGEQFGIDFPADATTLLLHDTEFLSRAFQASGALPATGSVTRVLESKEFIGGGTGTKLIVSVAYALPDPGLPERLFIKFSRNFDDELRDSARFMMVSESRFALLSRSPDFPVTVPECLFADVEPESGTGIIITECIPFGSNGMEPIYPKCLDYLVPEQLEHYKAIIKALARLSGTHRAGGLSPDFDKYFRHNAQQSAATLSIRSSREKLLDRAGRMFEFINGYPRLFPDNIRSPEFQRQFLLDIPDVVAAEEKVRALLGGNPDFFALCHWNANIDNCWFWRDPDGNLQCGFLDWANVGVMSVAQCISGAIGGAEKFLWDHHLDEILQLFIDEYAAHGGPRLDINELRLHIYLLLAVAGINYFMSAPVAIRREIHDLDALRDYRDERFQQAENARIQLHMMTKLLNVWQTRKLGDLVREVAR